MSEPYLAGLRVLDLSRVLAGPLAAQVLGDLGAEVLKVEPPAGDDTRAWGPWFQGGDERLLPELQPQQGLAAARPARAPTAARGWRSCSPPPTC